jgi:hypothetical protein
MEPVTTRQYGAQFRVRRQRRHSPPQGRLRWHHVAGCCGGPTMSKWQAEKGERTLERRLFCDPSSSIEYDAVTNPYCSRRSDNGVYPSAWVLAKIADLLPIVSNECPKNQTPSIAWARKLPPMLHLETRGRAMRRSAPFPRIRSRARPTGVIPRARARSQGRPASTD